jgi:agmatine deiminase
MIADWECNGVCLAGCLDRRHPALFGQLTAVLKQHGILVRTLAHVRDIWARDYSPLPVAPDRFIHFRYEPNYLTDHAEMRTDREVAVDYQDLGVCLASPINLDGGNVVTSGQRVILTDKVFRENPDWNRTKLTQELARLLEVEQVIVVPKEPYDPIGHADAMVRFVSPNRVLVNDYSTIDPSFGQRLTNVLARHGLDIVLLPYFQERRSSDGIPSAVGCFTNFLLTASVLVAPVYQHPSDGEAMETLRLAFPSLPIVPLDCTALAREGGILNCITAGFLTLPESAA